MHMRLGKASPRRLENHVVFTFNVKRGRCLVCSTITHVLSFVLVRNSADDQRSPLPISLYGDHLRRLDLSLIVVPHDIHVFIELTV